MSAVPEPPDSIAPALTPPTPPPPAPEHVPEPKPIATYALLGVIGGVFAVTWITHGEAFDIPAPQLVAIGGNFGPRTVEGESWRLLTSIFLHGGLLHWLMNTFALVSVGPLIERILGRWRFLALFLVCGLAGSLASLGLRPVTERIVSVGASGALFGLYGALGAFMLANRRALPPAQAKALGSIFVGFLVANLAFLPGVDHYAHGGGLVSGFFAGLLLAPLLGAARQGALGWRLLGGLPLLGLFLWLGGGAASRDYGYSPRQEERWPGQWQAFARDEEKAIALMTEIDRALGEKKLGDTEAAERVARELLPLWQATAARWGAYRLGPHSPSFQLHAAVANYLQVRIEHAKIMEAYYHSQVDAETRRLKNELDEKVQAINEALEVVKLQAEQRAKR